VNSVELEAAGKEVEDGVDGDVPLTLLAVVSL
jgi:hypothetical protein